MTVWDPDHRAARVAEASAGRRWEAGSPDPVEIEAYAAALPQSLDRGVLVLGGTPELRGLASERADRSIAMDRDAAALALPSGWPVSFPAEDVVIADWLDAAAILDGPVDAVLGDGVFGQLPDLDAQRALLDAMAALLVDGGQFVTRHAAVPDALDPDDVAWPRLVARHRAGALDDASFGLGVRVLGHLRCCWDPDTGVLDNDRLFAEMDEAHRSGAIDDHQHACFARYRAGGTTSLLRQGRWEALLSDAGWACERRELSGRWWYGWYAVHVCEPRPRSATATDP